MRISIYKTKSKSLVVAMGDIAFLLLIFLVSSTSFTGDDSIKVPQFSYTEEKGAPMELFLSLHSDGTLAIENVVLDEAALSVQLQAYPKSVLIKIYADANTSYTKVNNILNVLKAANYYNVMLMADKPKKSSYR